MVNMKLLSVRSDLPRIEWKENKSKHFCKMIGKFTDLFRWNPLKMNAVHLKWSFATIYRVLTSKFWVWILQWNLNEALHFLPFFVISLSWDIKNNYNDFDNDKRPLCSAVFLFCITRVISYVFLFKKAL